MHKIQLEQQRQMEDLERRAQIKYTPVSKDLSFATIAATNSTQIKKKKSDKSIENRTPQLSLQGGKTKHRTDSPAKTPHVNNQRNTKAIEETKSQNKGSSQSSKRTLIFEKPQNLSSIATNKPTSTSSNTKPNDTTQNQSQKPSYASIAKPRI